jgi:hypothetical protein
LGSGCSVTFPISVEIWGFGILLVTFSILIIGELIDC